MKDDMQDKASRALQALAELRDAALAECGLPRGRAAPDLAAFALSWRSAMTAHELAEEAMRVAAEYTSEFQVLRGGRVYCYGCGSASCEHAAPASVGQVFSGYQPTGRPLWEEFFNYLLALDDPRTDLLFAERRETLARVIGRTRLIAEQLTSFGKNSLTYHIWGQVVAGYVRLDGLRAALTAQLVETQDGRLHLQVITDDRVLEVLANAPSDTASVYHRIHDALAEARRQVFSLSNAWQVARRTDKRGATREKAFAVLRHLAHSIEQKGRQQQRRTGHAELRGQQQRPVHKAYEDLTSASPGDFFEDAMKHSTIVLGKAGRVHAFSDDGRHITSLTLPGDEIEQRQRRRRYLPLDPDAMAQFRAAALAAMSAGNGATTEDA